MKRDDFRLTRKNEYGDWSLYAAGDSEDVSPLLSGPANWVAGDWTRPNQLDFWRAIQIVANRST